MFSTSLTPSTLSIYCSPEGLNYLKGHGFEPNGDKAGVYAFVRLEEDGNFFMSPIYIPKAKKYSFALQNGLTHLDFRLGIAVKNLERTTESVGHGWTKTEVKPVAYDNGTLRLMAPSARSPDNGRHKLQAGARRYKKKSTGLTLLAELPDGGTLVFDNVPLAEVMHLNTQLALKGYESYTSQTHRITRTGD